MASATYEICFIQQRRQRSVHPFSAELISAAVIHKSQHMDEHILQVLQAPAVGRRQQAVPVPQYLLVGQFKR